MSIEAPREFDPRAGLVSLKGDKEYLPVAQRVVWFRHEYPEAQIKTIPVTIDRDAGFAMFRAEIATGQGGYAEATGTETGRDFTDYIEKAETKSVGRALGYLGYGTAAAGFDEAGAPVYAPQEPRRLDGRRGHQAARTQASRGTARVVEPTDPASGAAGQGITETDPPAGKRTWTVESALAYIADVERPQDKRVHLAKWVLSQANDLPTITQYRAALVPLLDEELFADHYLARYEALGGVLGGGEEEPIDAEYEARPDGAGDEEPA